MRVVFAVHTAIPGLAEEGDEIILRLDDRARPISVTTGHGPEALPILCEHADHVRLLGDPDPCAPALLALARLLLEYDPELEHALPRGGGRPMANGGPVRRPDYLRVE